MCAAALPLQLSRRPAPGSAERLTPSSAYGAASPLRLRVPRPGDASVASVGLSSVVSRASAAGDLVAELRRLREGVVLASACDAALASRVERLQLQRSQAAQAHRLAERSRGGRDGMAELEISWMTRESSRWSRGTCAIVLSVWTELAGRERVVREYLEECVALFVLSRAFKDWWEAAGACRLESGLDALQAEVEQAREAADRDMAVLQSTLLHIKLESGFKLLQTTCGTSRMHANMMLQIVVEKWVGLTAQNREARRLRTTRLRNNGAILRLSEAAVHADILRHWKEQVDESRKARHLRDTMARSLMSLADQDTRTVLEVALQAWEKHVAMVRHHAVRTTRRSVMLEHCQVVLMQQQEQEKIMRANFKSGAAKAMLAAVEGGCLVMAWKAWRCFLNREAAEDRLETLQRELDRFSSVRVAMHISRAHFIDSSKRALDALSPHLCFLAWLHTCFVPERSRLHALDAQRTDLTNELRQHEGYLRHQSMEHALGSLVRVLRSRILVTRGDALRRWHVKTLLAQAEVVRQHGAGQPRLAAAARDDLEALREEAHRQRLASAHVVLGAFAAWRRGLTELTFHSWHVLAHSLKNDADFQRKERDTEMHLLRMEAEEREHQAQLTRAALAMAAAPDASAIGAAVLHAWHGAVLGRRAEKQLLEFEECARAQEREMEERVASRTSASKDPMSAFLAKQLGAAEPVPVESLLREWRCVATQLRLQRLYEEKRHATNRDKFEICEEATDRIAELAGVTALRWWSWAVQVQRLERNRTDTKMTAELRLATRRRLRAVVQLRAWASSEGEALETVLAAFVAWRSLSNIAVVERASAEEKRRWEAHVTSVESDMLAQKTSAAAALAACFNSSRGTGHLWSLVELLYLPAWRRQVQLERGIQEVFHLEEQSLRSLQELRARALCRQRRWAWWAANGQPRARALSGALQALKAWSYCAARARSIIAKDRVQGQCILAADRMMEGGRRRLRMLCLSAWRRLHREEVVRALEDRVRRAEIHLAHIAGEDNFDLSRFLPETSDGASDYSSEEEASELDVASPSDVAFPFGPLPAWRASPLTSPGFVARSPPASPVVMARSPPASPVVVARSPPASPVMVARSPSSPVFVARSPPASPVVVARSPVLHGVQRVVAPPLYLPPTTAVLLPGADCGPRYARIGVGSPGGASSLRAASPGSPGLTWPAAFPSCASAPMSEPIACDVSLPPSPACGGRYAPSSHGSLASGRGAASPAVADEDLFAQRLRKFRFALDRPPP